MKSRPSVVLLLLCALLGWAIASQLRAAFTWGAESWQISDWLINYSGGFVRRGLAGSAFWHLSRISGIQANHLAIATSTLCYGLLAGWLLRKSAPHFPACLILSCVVMGFPAYQDSIVRKDCLGLLALIACLRLADAPISHSLRVVTMNLVAVTAILIHEIFAFYALPALILLNPIGTRNGGDAWPRRIIALLPAIATLVIVVACHGTPSTARAIHESWNPLWHKIAGQAPIPSEPATAIQAIGWTTREGINLVIPIFTSAWHQPYMWIAIFGASFLLMVRFTGETSSRSPQAALRADRLRFSSLLVFQLFCIAPLFLLGIDYGRWLFIWSTSSIILFLMRRELPPALGEIVERSNRRIRFIDRLERIPPLQGYFLVFGVPILWNIPNFISASPLGRLAIKLAALLHTP